MTLKFGAFVLSGALGGLTLGVDYVESGTTSLVFLMILLFVAATCFAWMVLSFIASILLNVIDASYACLILDLDQSLQSKQFQQPEIAQAILVKVKPGYVVGTPVVAGTAAAADV